MIPDYFYIGSAMNLEVKAVYKAKSIKKRISKGKQSVT